VRQSLSHSTRKSGGKDSRVGLEGNETRQKGIWGKDGGLTRSIEVSAVLRGLGRALLTRQQSRARDLK